MTTETWTRAPRPLFLAPAAPALGRQESAPRAHPLWALLRNACIALGQPEEGDATLEFWVENVQEMRRDKA